MIDAREIEKPGPQNVVDAVATLASNRETGLASAEAALCLERDGPNEVPEKRSHPVLSFMRKFWGLSAWMLELIAALSFVLGKWTDFWIALSLLLVNAVLSFLQEQRATTAVNALRRQLQITARVLHDGRWQPTPARQLVRGDVIRVRVGDFVPADTQIITGELQVDQSALTGESRDLGKTTDGVLYSASIVRQGEATAVVVGTGSQTYFGRTAQLVESAHPKLHIEEVITRAVRWLFLIVGTVEAPRTIAECAWQQEPASTHGRKLDYSSSRLGVWRRGRETNLSPNLLFSRINSIKCICVS